MAVAASIAAGEEPGELLKVPLATQLATKRAEAALLQAQMQTARLEAQQLRLHLQAVGADPSLVPTKIHAGAGCPEPQQLSELRALLQWLVESVDFSRHVVFDCGGEVVVGGRRVMLQRMATWQLSGRLPGGSDSGSGAALKLSVPLDLQPEIAAMLAAARQRGRLDEAAVQRLADAWEMVGTEVVSSAMGCPEPAIFLVHRESARAITVTRWPSVDFAPAAAPGVGFDPDRHFARLAAERAPPPAMPRKVRVAPPQLPPLPTAAAACVPPLTLSVSTGDRVEVECEGHWITGVLQCVCGGVANIQCDEASPGVITVAPLASIRPARPAQDVTPKKWARHMRAKSTG